MHSDPNPVNLYPSVSDTFGHGWNTMKRFFPELLLVFVIQLIFSLPMGLVNAFQDELSFGYVFFSLFNFFYGLIIMAPLSYGACWIFLKAVRGESFRVQEMFDAYRHTTQIILANILAGIVIVIGIALLIIPGIIFACKLALVPYLVMDRKMEATEAIRTSWAMTRGHAWTIFGMGIASFFIAVAGLICLIVGIIPAAIWISVAFAAIYHAISSHGRAHDAGDQADSQIR